MFVYIRVIGCKIPSLVYMISVLCHCWLGIRPVKTEWWGAGMVICLGQGADLHLAQLMPLPLSFSWFSKIQIGFTFLVPAHPDSTGPGQSPESCKMVVV